MWSVPQEEEMGKQFEDEVVWITGGGTGLGKECAKHFAKRGAIVVVSGRREDRLLETVRECEALGAKSLAIACDVTSQESMQDALSKILEHFGRLDVILANAGFAVSGRFEDLNADDWRRQFETNVFGLINTVKVALPELKKTRGRVALVGSVAGFLISPGVGAYHSSKYAVRAIGQLLSVELHGSGVTCTTIHPGFVKSEISQVDNKGVFHPEWTDRRPQKLMWETDKAASVMVDAIYWRRREFVFTQHGKVAAWLGRCWPDLVHFVLTRSGGGYKRQ
jgi:NAD(P)-dependent dehydrogenase (short-subunit alcohol dehydrogenase family)